MGNMRDGVQRKVHDEDLEAAVYTHLASRNVGGLGVGFKPDSDPGRMGCLRNGIVEMRQRRRWQAERYALFPVDETG